MSTIVASDQTRRSWSIPGWVAAVILLVGTAVIGGPLGSLSRLLFVVGCGGVGWYAWRQGPGAHLQAALMMWTFAPFVRRLVDLSIGYDTLGLMLIGPLLTILVPVIFLPKLLEQRSVPARWLWPLMIVAACVVYAMLLTMAQGDWTNTASGTLKYIAPLLYSVVLLLCADRDEVIEAATSAFKIILPVTGIYGIYQYVDPPVWDRYWMSFAPIISIGQPLPYSVRVFSTMNAPAPYGSFTGAGLLLIAFSRRSWSGLLLSAPALLGFLLSMLRTAWLGLVLEILFCLLFTQTRRRAGMILIAATVAVVLAATLTPFGDVVADRLSSLSEGSQDGSAQERVQEFVTLWNQPDSSLFGTGFGFNDAAVAGMMPVDGVVVASWLYMGIVVGGICVLAMIWAIINAVLPVLSSSSTSAVMVAALALGALWQLPLSNIASGESGFLFWSFVVLLASRPGEEKNAGTNGQLEVPR